MATKVDNTTAKTINDSDVFLIDLKNLAANSAQSRGAGVLPALKDMGYGLFEKLPDHDDKEPIWSLLLSDDPAKRKEGAGLIQGNEGHIIDLAESIDAEGQLQNIVVTEMAGGKYDVTAGMRRSIALALNYALDTKNKRVISAKLLSKMKEVDLLFIGLDENGNRQDNNPIDKAITYKKLQNEYKIKADEIGKRQGLSGQSIRNHIKLLDPLLSDKLNDIRTGKLTIDKALKRLVKLKSGENGEEASTNDPNKRARMHSVKKLITAYGAKKKPEWMDQKEWELITKEDVRRYLALKLKLKYKDFTGELVSEEPEEGEEAPKAAPKKKANNSTSPVPGYKIKFPRSVAVKLLTALGKEDAASMEDLTLKAKLENIVALADENTTLEDAALQGHLTKLLTNYSKGIQVTIVAPKA